MKPTYHIVSHSHWDREWYRSFEQFRAMLVEMIDDLLDILRRDPGFRHFTLDGQTVVLEDYLEVRPENRDEIRRLVGEGRIVTGPWYVLPDEFLVSGESTVRNLMTGMRMAASFGGTMTVGYIPDSFGHIAMMPAILKGFGIDTALVYRGFGGEPGQQMSEYWWQAPDGTRALMIHLFRHGYSAGYFHGETDGEILKRFASLREELDRRASTSHRLLMNGGDHHWPDPQIPATLELLRKSFEGTFEHSTVERYASAVRHEILPSGSGMTHSQGAPVAPQATPVAPPVQLPVVEGELRFGYRYAFVVLGGVYSSRMYIKQANWKSEMLLERYAEPLNALGRASGKRTRLAPSQAPLLHHAWRSLMKNHPHDSICGCSIDAVHREMMTRFAAVEQTGGAVVDAALCHILPCDDAASGDDTYLFLFNPSPFPRTGTVEAEVRFFRRDVVVGLNPDVVVDPEIPPVKGFALIDSSGSEAPFQFLRREKTYDITYSHYNYPRQTLADRFSILVGAKDVPPLGFRGFRVEKRAQLLSPPPAVRAGKNYIENRYLRVSVGPGGALTVRDRIRGKEYRGLNVFEDSGDVGDEYNYSYPAHDTVVRSGKGRARVSVLERGPLRASLLVSATLRIPGEASPDRKRRGAGTVALPVKTRISLGEHSRFVECETTVENRGRDHRLRVLFPLGIRTDRVLADSQFCIVERVQRTYDVRSFTIEHPAQVAPMQRFVTVNGPDRSLTLLAYGLPEYELILDGKGTLALTLLRCVGLLAADDLITRPGGKAGWHNETPDAQCQGLHVFRYALLPHGPEDPAWGEFVARESESFHLPILPFRRKNASPLPLESSLFALEGGPLVLSALKESEDGTGIIVRVYNPGPAAVEGTLRCARPVKEAQFVNLNEEPSARAEVAGDPRGAAIPLRVPSGGIVTVCVRLEGTS
jgi:alpha-mannosidase